MFHPLRPGTVDIYFINIYEINPQLRQTMLQVLDREETERYQRLKLLETKMEFVVGRFLIKTFLSSLFGIKPQQIQFRQNEYGKLYLTPEFQTETDDIYFNISHSHGVVAIAVTTGFEIGVDIEKVGQPIFDIVERFFSPTEQSYISNCHRDYQNTTAYQLWTLKEAFIKSQGKGLSVPLNSFDIFHVAKEVFFLTLQPIEGYYLSIAVQNGTDAYQSRLQAVDHNLIGYINKTGWDSSDHID